MANDLKIKVTLTVVEGEDHEKSVLMNKPEFIIGRSHTDFNLSDGRISIQHVKVEIQGSKVFVQDLDSRNGTILGGKKIQGRTEVRNLDEIELGFTKIRINIVENLEVFKNKQFKMIDERTVKNADIGSLISDELERFSKWDLSNPSIEELGRPKEAKHPYGLQVKQGPDRGKIFLFDQDRMVVGRGKVDFVLKDPDVSRMHAIIEIKDDKITVKDMDSTNGTFINGKKIAAGTAHEGDVVQFGKTYCLLFKSESGD